MPRRDVEERVDHLVGNAVAHLVGMTFGNRFTGEQIARTRQVDLPGVRVTRAGRVVALRCSCSGAPRGQDAAGTGVPGPDIRLPWVIFLRPRRRSAAPDRRCDGAAWHPECA